MTSSDSQQLLPGWLPALLTENYFSACIVHEEARNNEKNVFCLDCCEAICPHCFILHGSHRLLQIRRYIYHDVLRLKDAQKWFDSALVQSYISNGEKVLFLKQRPVSKPCRISAKPCVTCYRAVQPSFTFCSIFCKLQHLVKTGAKLSDHIYGWESPEIQPEPNSGDDDEEEKEKMTPETVLEPAESVSSASGGSAGGRWTDCRRMLASTELAIEIVRKKRSSLGSSSFRASSTPPPATATAIRRRKNQRKKGMPRRSPLN
ncbi:unnamed protein product [Cuscuta campestris]|uniref:B box-type domain-containing protein n=1 Tax=Cuscuta campestris TaxID=132261 RepID=A0A484N1Q7_9ASTE|nr:unnamed protein product [Cuscuta campestris]